MTNQGPPEQDSEHAEGGGATEPITLTDPDGSVTRVAPWSSWTREQVRAPGGEPALVTRLEVGQLWFAAGRRRSPWRHEIVAGPATVTTPSGRFHVVAEADGGATVVCLAGRTRVASQLREPVVLSPNQTAAVSSDGATLVVTDVEPVEGTSAVAEQRPYLRDDLEEPVIALPAVVSTALEGPINVVSDVSDDRPSQRRWPWLPEFVAVAALLGVLVASALLFVRGTDGTQDVAAVAPVTTTVSGTNETPTTSEVPVTTVAPTTTAPPTASTTAVTTTTPPALAAPATATGTLSGCRRADGGVEATITVIHRSGGPGMFSVEVGLADTSGTFFAQATSDSAQLEPGASAPVDVLIPVDGRARGACELIGVTPA